MTRSSIRALFLAALVVLAAAAAAHAQVDTSKPIVIKELKPKRVTFRGEVMHATPAEITVRSRENERVLKTFTYSPQVRDHMQRIIERGGYQYGDKVEIQHEAGGNVALRIKGKPSKPL